jgi:DNA adenine methylase
MGAGWVFFGKPRSKVEVLNDLDDELINLFEVVRTDVEAFAKGCEYLLRSRRQYQLFKAADPKLLCACARAVRFYYLITLGFGCKRTQMTFGVTTTSGARRFDPEKVAAAAREIHRRLAGVTIECLPATDCIARYDRPTTFFYIDPHYHGVTQPYVATMDEGDQEALRDRLAGIKGRFLLTLNDHPFIRRLYRRFEIEAMPTRYSLPTEKAARDRVEHTLFIGNYDHRAAAQAVQQ